MINRYNYTEETGKEGESAIVNEKYVKIPFDDNVENRQIENKRQNAWQRRKRKKKRKRIEKAGSRKFYKGVRKEVALYDYDMTKYSRRE